MLLVSTCQAQEWSKVAEQRLNEIRQEKLKADYEDKNKKAWFILLDLGMSNDEAGEFVICNRGGAKYHWKGLYFDLVVDGSHRGIPYWYKLAIFDYSDSLFPSWIDRDSFKNKEGFYERILWYAKTVKGKAIRTQAWIRLN